MHAEIREEVERPVTPAATHCPVHRDRQRGHVLQWEEGNKKKRLGELM
jgi:hypothetical protein